jgi:hypothetical protein
MTRLHNWAPRGEQLVDKVPQASAQGDADRRRATQEPGCVRGRQDQQPSRYGEEPLPWPIEQKRDYVDWARAVVAGLPFKPPALLAHFEEAAILASDTIEAEERTRRLETSRAAKEIDSIETA